MKKVIIDNFEQINIATKAIENLFIKKINVVPENFTIQFRIKDKQRRELMKYLDENKIKWLLSKRKIWFSFRRLMFSKAFIIFHLNNIRVEIYKAWIYPSDINFYHENN